MQVSQAFDDSTNKLKLFKVQLEYKNLEVEVEFVQYNEMEDQA